MPTPDPSPHPDTAQSSLFYLLDERIQRWIWPEGREELREVSSTSWASPLLWTAGAEGLVCRVRPPPHHEYRLMPFDRPSRRW